MWGTIREYLRNLESYPYHLYVTLVENNPELESSIKAFHSLTSFFYVENRGYDIGPFVFFLSQIDLSKYDFILKIHTKNASSKMPVWVNILYISGWMWAHLLLRSLLGSKKRVQRNLEIFRQNPSIGMIGAADLIIPENGDDPIVITATKETLSRFGYSLQHYMYVAGTMFMVRSHILQDIKDNYTLADFELSDKTGADCSLAHILERTICALTLARGFYIKGVCPNIQYSFQRIKANIKRNGGIWRTIKRTIREKKRR